MGEILLDRKLIDEEQLNKGLKHQKESGKMIGESLIDLGFIDEEKFAQVLAIQYGMPYISLNNYHFDSELIARVPQAFIEKHHIIPLDKIGHIVTVAICDILSPEQEKELESIYEGKVRCFLTSVSDTKVAFKKIVRIKK